MTGDNTDTTGDSPAPDDIPEVDAEIVNDDAVDRPGPFDEPAPSAPTPAPKQSMVSAGVLLFAGLVLVASAAGAVWFFTKGEEKTPAASEPPASPSASTPASPPASPPASTPQTEPGASEASGDKLVNALAPRSKPDTPPTRTPDETFADTVAALPAPAQTIANASLHDAAKEAIIDAGPPQDAHEVAPPGAQGDDANVLSEAGAAHDPQPEATPDDTLLTNYQSREDSLDAVDAATNFSTGETPIIQPADIAPDSDGLNRESVASLQAALADERQRIAALEAALEDARRDAAASDEALRGARAQTDAARAAIARLRAENDALKTASGQSPVAAGAIALNAIIEAGETGAPYTSALATLKRAEPDETAIDVLERYARSGAPSLSEIRANFDAAARAGLANANRENADGVVENYGARIAGLFNIRPATPQPGAAPGAIISRAEDAVDRGDLSLAVFELEALPTSAQNAMGEWMMLARARTEFEVALRSINADLAERTARGTL